MGGSAKIMCFIPFWILTIVFLNINTISCAVISGEIKGPQTANEGDSVNLICSATCTNGTCQKKWTSSESRTQETFSITSVKRTDAGPYTCQVSDGDGISKNFTRILKVNYGPDEAVINTANPKIVSEGYSSITIDCGCGTCQPGCVSEWTLPDNSTSATLVFTNVSRKARGQYTCTCTNTAGGFGSKKKSFTLDVRYPPDITLNWNGISKSLTCTAEGNPPNYNFRDWRHSVRGTTVRNLTGAIEANTNTLVLKGENPYMDTGTYTCGVDNGVRGSTETELQTKTFLITIEDKPKVLHYQAEYNVSKGSNVSIIMEIYTVPSLSSSGVSVTHTNSSVKILGVGVTIDRRLVNVMFHGQVVQTYGYSIEIIIEEVKEDYFGELVVQMTNAVGVADPSPTLTLIAQGPPDPPTNITYSANVDSVLFRLKPGFCNGANQTFVVEYSTDKNASSWSNGSFVEAGNRKAPDYFKEVTVHGLQAETTYYFRLKGINQYAESDYTDTIEIKTLEEPLNVGAVAGGVTAGVVLVVIVVIVICIIKRRTGKADRKLAQPIPLPSIIDRSTTDLAPIMAQPPKTYMDNGNTNSVVYENIKKEGIIRIKNESKDQKEHIYSNTVLESGQGKQENHYQNFEVATNLKKEGSSSKLDSKEPSDDYYNRKDMEPETTKTDNKVPDTNSGAGMPGHETYLDMEVKKEVKDYMNVEQYKKPKPNMNEIYPHKTVSMETYVSMETSNTGKRESVPDYTAPPPPQPAEEDYMNLQLGKKS